MDRLNLLKIKFGVETEELEKIRRERDEAEHQRQSLFQANQALSEYDGDEPIWIDNILVGKDTASMIIQERLTKCVQYCERLSQVQLEYETKITYMHEQIYLLTQ